MKRENLYRGKLEHSGKWVEGNLIIANNGQSYIYPSDIIEPDGYNLHINSDDSWRVIPETVGQFTGLLEKTEIGFLKAIF